ncbi:hypothetical protein Tco_0146473 [Tanacetum coccineum]
MRDVGRLKTKRELVRITIDDGNAFWKEIGDTDVVLVKLLRIKEELKEESGLQRHVTDDGQKVLDLEKVKTAQAKEITSLKKRVKQLEKRRKLQAGLIEEERLARQKEEEANIVLIKSWDNTQAMMEADFELAQRLQAKEQGEITIEERSRLFIELNRKKKHFAKLRAEEIRRKPPTKAQKRN